MYKFSEKIYLKVFDASQDIEKIVLRAEFFWNIFDEFEFQESYFSNKCWFMGTHCMFAHGAGLLMLLWIPHSFYT